MKNGKWILLVILILVLGFILFFFVSIISLLFVGVEAVETGNVAVIPVAGVIISGDGYAGRSFVTADSLINRIEKADTESSIEAIVLEINSPGGSAVASDEVATAVKKAEKPIYAVIREVGASGAYWIATAADEVYANRMSITGSIGVIASYVELAELMDEYNVTYQRLVAGKFKDMGSPLKRLSEDEKEILQGDIDLIHQYFIDAIAENRHLDSSVVRELSDGRIYLGSQALEKGLIDQIGSKYDVKEKIEKDMNITVEFAEYRQEFTLVDILRGAASDAAQNIGIGIGSALTEPRMGVWT